MPTPFACHWCDKPTMSGSGICIECEQKYEEGNKDIAANVRELETRIRWLEKGLKLISTASDQHNPIHLREQAQATLDGEPTTADEVNKDECPIPGSRDYWEPKDKNVVLISDVNKEIAKEWKTNKGE